MKYINKNGISPLLAIALTLSTLQLDAQIVKFDEAKEVKAAMLGVERIAPGFLPVYTMRANNNRDVKWVQIDLGKIVTVDCIKLLPSSKIWVSNGFPVAYRVECSVDSLFKHPILFADMERFPQNGPKAYETVTFDSKVVQCRYIRITATKLADNVFCLSKIVVISGGKTISTCCHVTDSDNTSEDNRALLTAPPRPMGDFVVTDNLDNVIPEKKWNAIKNVVETPLGGITLQSGLFKTVMDNNVSYLLNSFPKEDLVRNFKVKAGLPVSPLNPKYNSWMITLPGSEAGRFLMGAGNTLRWMDNGALRDELDYIINVIDSCKEPDGWCMAYQKHEIFNGECGAYARSWVTHGLIDAGLAGNKKAFTLLRDFYDYLDNSPYLPEMLRRCSQGTQGMIPFTRTYFSPVGKAEDLKVAMRYFQQNFFIEQLAKRDPAIIWRYPYDRPHNYLLTAIEPYFDLYRATGQTKYLEAVKGAWDLFHDNWEMPGGEMSINEGNFLYEPKSYWLHKEAGELCGNAFWIKINQRFHNLYPEDEKYVGEIEKSIYNVCIANQYGPYGIRYFARLDGQKDREHDAGHGFAENTCCEGQGTRIYGSLPEYMYSFAKDGVYIDLYGASSVTLPMDKGLFGMHIDTKFPYDNGVVIKISHGAKAKLRLRIPAWTAQDVAININGEMITHGHPGTYVTIDRQWQQGDEVEFSLPMDFKMTKYKGKEPGFENNHYAIEYGPILMAVVGVKGKRDNTFIHSDIGSLSGKLKPVPGKPLHFAIDGEEQYELWPYFEVQEEPFTCFPEISGQ